MRAALLLLAMCTSANAVDLGYFKCFDLTQDDVKWFASVGNCCSIADGMPTLSEDREDGTYIQPFEETYSFAIACRDGQELPPPRADHSAWIKLPIEKNRIKNNPIGVPVVWWTNSGYLYSTNHEIRCFVDISKS